MTEKCTCTCGCHLNTSYSKPPCYPCVVQVCSLSVKPSGAAATSSSSQTSPASSSFSSPSGSSYLSFPSASSYLSSPSTPSASSYLSNPSASSYHSNPSAPSVSSYLSNPSAPSASSYLSDPSAPSASSYLSNPSDFLSPSAPAFDGSPPSVPSASSHLSSSSASSSLLSPPAPSFNTSPSATSVTTSPMTPSAPPLPDEKEEEEEEESLPTCQVAVATVPSIGGVSVYQLLFGYAWTGRPQSDASTNTTSPSMEDEEVLEQTTDEGGVGQYLLNDDDKAAAAGTVALDRGDFSETHIDGSPSDNQMTVQNYLFSRPMNDTPVETQDVTCQQCDCLFDSSANTGNSPEDAVERERDQNLGNLPDQIKRLILGTNDFMFRNPNALHVNNMHENLYETRRMRRSTNSTTRVNSRSRSSSNEGNDTQYGSSLAGSNSLVKEEKYRAINKINRRETSTEAALRYQERVLADSSESHFRASGFS